jgi:hypothetical protein
MQSMLDEVEVGSALLVVGYPLGFHDVIYHLPVVRHAVIASSFGVDSRARATFDGCAHPPWDQRRSRGDAPGTNPALPWKLLGVYLAFGHEHT